MSGAECVVDVDLGKVGQFLGEAGIVLFFFRVETQVFEQRHLRAGLRLGDGLLRKLADAVGREHDWPLQ